MSCTTDWKQPMRKRNRRQQGFTMVETVIVIAIIMIVTAYAVIQTSGSLESSKANAAMDTVMSQLRTARQMAISQRRNVQVQFNPSDNFYNPPLPSVTYTVLSGIGTNSGAVTTPLQAISGTATVKMPLVDRVTFMGFPGVPDTPMGFGTCAGNYGVCIGGVAGGPSTMLFNATGQFTDSTAVTPLNGTIFIGIADPKISSANFRAVTIMGATGRVRPYSFIGPITATSQQAWME
jgi:prepilin-type N-terminal cleavage/methylation domain-containing protein